MRKLWILCLTGFILSGCSSKSNTPYIAPEVNSVYYEIYVGSFYDSDGDGMGDLSGVLEKLDYIQYDLGATGIWLMPINPSPTYHKYDVVDYKGIDQAYGSMEDFNQLIAAMNERGMDLILDLVLNHSSAQHPWFIKAKNAVLNNTCDTVKECDYYIFEKTSYPGFTQLTQDVWYESVFWDQMPDLNLDNESLREEILDIAKFWLDKGVKGFRLDATTHFYQENSSLNIEFLNWFNDEVKAIRNDAYLVGEAWTGESIVTRMYESKIDSFFNFGFAQNSGRIVRALRNEKGHDLAKYTQHYQETIRSYNEHAIDAIFLSNHDNDRSAGYLLDENQKKMAANVYLLMPGNVFLYYGEEIAMRGSGIDENKRMPMLWSKTDKTGKTFGPSNANYTLRDPQYVDDAMKDKDSLWNHYKKVISVRNKYSSIARGDVISLDLGHSELYALDHGDVIVIHNLSNKTLSYQKDYREVVSVYGNISSKGNNITMEGYSTLVIVK